MSIFGDDHPRTRTKTPSPGEDLYGLSVSELDERVAIYKAEIERLEVERDKKQAETNAAHAIFGKKT